MKSPQAIMAVENNDSLELTELINVVEAEGLQLILLEVILEIVKLCWSELFDLWKNIERQQGIQYCAPIGIKLNDAMNKNSGVTKPRNSERAKRNTKTPLKTNTEDRRVSRRPTLFADATKFSRGCPTSLLNLFPFEFPCLRKKVERNSCFVSLFCGLVMPTCFPHMHEFH